MSKIALHRVDFRGGVITGSHEEVARVSDLWIPYSPAIEVSVKGSSIQTPNFSGGMKVQPSMLDGWSISRSQVFNAGSNLPVIIMGDYERSANLPSPPVVNVKRIQDATMQGLSDVLPQVLIHMLGGKVTILHEDIQAVEGKGLLQFQVNDPHYYTVELI